MFKPGKQKSDYHNLLW